MAVGKIVTKQESVGSPGQLENQYRKEEEKERVSVCRGTGDERIMFHPVRKGISM